MAFFTSEYECKLDAKGRLVLPAKIKTNLPEVSTNELVLRKESDHLILYPMLEYKKIHLKFSALNDFDPEQAKLKRLFFKSIAQVELDGAGRILVPKAMLSHVKIEREAVLLGMGDKVEIWNPDEYYKESDDDFSTLAQKFIQ
ncbi:MAG: division/cell wall cluster transcriptional repressor MraZ [Cyclobacteriaceae bacterium]